MIRSSAADRPSCVFAKIRRASVHQPPGRTVTVAEAIARIQRKIAGLIGVSVRSSRVRPRFHPRATAARGREPSLSPGGVRAGRVTPEQNARRCDTSPQAEQLRLVETLFVRPMRKPSRRRPRPHVGGFYREIDGPAGLVESVRSTGLSHSSSSAIAALGRRQGVLGPELPPVGGTGGLRHRGPRRRDRRGAVAAAARAPPANPATRPGATCPTRTAFTWGRGRPPASTST